MNFWWVNHAQTARQEIEGGYLWSPKRRRDGARSQSYDFMREARPRDAVVSFARAQIGHSGVVSGFPISAPKPDEFGRAGENWSNDGWLVPVSWERVERPFRPKDHIEQLRPLLPEKYSPIQEKGNGNQGAYLARISEALFAELAQLGSFRPNLDAAEAEFAHEGAVVADIEDRIQAGIEADPSLDQTDVVAVVKARRGQGLFRRNVERREPRCRVTGLSDKRLLVASHIKPWRSCTTSHERLDGANGLMLAPHVDRLFDLGLISFRQDGELLASSALDETTLACLGLSDALESGVRAFADDQEAYLLHHRESVYLG